MSKKSFLDSVEVKTPCEQSWDEMHGTDEIRFCDHCAKDVHNLSQMTRKRAGKIIAAANGNICVRYVRRPDGRIQTLKNTLHQITRQTGIAAGILGTSLGVSTLAYAQTPTDSNQIENSPIAAVLNQKSDQPNGTISGTISDPNGAVIPFAFVTVSNTETNFYQSANTNQDGFYEFKDVPPGENYKIKFEASGFEAKEIAQISVGGGREETQNALLAIQNVQTEVVVSSEDSNISYSVGGSMISTVSQTKNKLILAVQADNLDEVKMLIAKGKRVNVRDRNYDGNSPLHFAVENGNLEIVQILLNAGAKINFKNSEKRTPLMMLDEDATPELVNLLLRYGAQIELADKGKNTALMMAASYSSKDVVQTLINAGASVNVVNKQGETALMHAAENGETEIVQLLLGAGANANLRNRDGKTALSIAQNEEAKQFLIAFGASR